MSEERQHQTQGQNHREEHKVEVTLDHKVHHVYPGPNVVSTFKEIVHVSASNILDEVSHGHKQPLDDGATIEIKGGEVFISRLREHKVEVTVDHKPHHVFPGPYVVSTFKEIVHVPVSKVLEQVVGGELKLLADNETIEIKSGEVFISHVRTGGSSR